MENNTITFFDTIVDELSGKAFTKEDLQQIRERQGLVRPAVSTASSKATSGKGLRADINDINNLQHPLHRFRGLDVVLRGGAVNKAQRPHCNTYNSNETIDDNVWMSKDGFSIRNITSYPELSDDELRMLSELMKYYDYSPSDCHDGQSSQFIEELKQHRENITEWYKFLYPPYMGGELSRGEYDKEAWEYAQRIKLIRTSSGDDAKAWVELYSNKEYVKKIMEEAVKVYIEQQAAHLRSPRNTTVKKGLTDEERKINIIQRLRLI